METITSKFDRKAVPESPVESEFARGFLRETQDFSLVLGEPLFSFSGDLTCLTTRWSSLQVAL